MTPRHHAPEDLLVGYAAGTLSEAESLLIASHLSLCPNCRSHHERLEAIGGAMLESVAPAAVSPDVLSAMLAMLDTPAPPPPPRPELPPAFADLNLPGPLRDYVARSGRTDWETIIPGVAHQLTLPLSVNGTPVRLARMRGLSATGPAKDPTKEQGGPGRPAGTRHRGRSEGLPRAPPRPTKARVAGRRDW